MIALIAAGIVFVAFGLIAHFTSAEVPVLSEDFTVTVDDFTRTVEYLEVRAHGTYTFNSSPENPKHWIMPRDLPTEGSHSRIRALRVKEHLEFLGYIVDFTPPKVAPSQVLHPIDSAKRK